MIKHGWYWLKCCLINKSACYTFLYFLQSMPHSQSQTVVVENPMSVDESGKLVSAITCFCFLIPPNQKRITTTKQDLPCPSIFLWAKKDVLIKILNVTGEQCCCWGHNRQKVIQWNTRSIAVILFCKKKPNPYYEAPWKIEVEIVCVYVGDCDDWH